MKEGWYLNPYLADLKRYEFFSLLSEGEVTRLSQAALYHRIPKGQILFFREDPVIYYYFIFKGLLRLEQEDSTGDYRYIDYVAEESFCPYAEFLAHDHHVYTAIAQTDLEIAYLSKALLEEIVTHNNDQLKYMYQNLCNTQFYLEKRVQMTAVPSASVRVLQTLALWMYDMAKFDQQQVIIPHPLTITELALVAGTTRETASRVVKVLKDDGRISINRKNIIYHDWQYFEKLIET